jgi:hypothetical protein
MTTGLINFIIGGFVRRVMGVAVIINFNLREMKTRGLPVEGNDC